MNKTVESLFKLQAHIAQSAPQNPPNLLELRLLELRSKLKSYQDDAFMVKIAIGMLTFVSLSALILSLFSLRYGIMSLMLVIPSIIIISFNILLTMWLIVSRRLQMSDFVAERQAILRDLSNPNQQQSMFDMDTRKALFDDLCKLYT